eukprot:594269-Pyramimonas_sp.AAC.1
MSLGTMPTTGSLRNAPLRRSPIANFRWNAAAAATRRSRTHSTMCPRTSASRAGIWEWPRWALYGLSGFHILVLSYAIRQFCHGHWAADLFEERP